MPIKYTLRDVGDNYLFIKGIKKEILNWIWDNLKCQNEWAGLRLKPIVRRTKNAYKVNKSVKTNRK